MKTLRRLGLPGLLLAVTLALASCGGSGGGGQGMQGMNHSGGSGDTQASEQAAPETTGDMQGMEGMDHGSTNMDEMARTMVTPNGEYSDAAFVDAMVPHHEGAVEMAEVALDNAEHEEIRTLAREIIDSQRAEIEMFGQLRGGLDGPTMEEMSEEEMNRSMGMMDAQDLAGQQPFDRAFIDAMMPHHESAVAMAEVALEESENPEIRRIAEDIVSAQKREISQMREWREEWYPQG
ncbi:MAG: DUF305 domain-containing protein [Actinomycetota bacterium]|nr:DUF305 domain-containing protein [Actinomycetota bacterium]